VTETKRVIAACGIDCTPCLLYNADADAGAAQGLVPWFRQEGWLKQGEGVTEIMKRGPYCRGCGKDRSVQWSPDCWILECCVNAKELAFCSECEGFPCMRLREWAAQNTRYMQALNRLRSMKNAAVV